LVAFPTETVYGLGADARSGHAVAALYALKGRPSFNPLIVHVESVMAAEAIAQFDDRARLLAATFWPGPLSLVLPLRIGGVIDPLVTAGLPTVAVRVPAQKTALALLRAFDGPIAAPSANRSGSLSPTTPLHVASSFGHDAPMILADGPCGVGLESTILDCSGAIPTILRAGAITADDLASILGEKVTTATQPAPDGTVRSPGQMLQHYAPRTPLRLRAVDVIPGEALLAFGPTRFMGVRGGGSLQDLPPGAVRNLSETGDLVEAAANLFRSLHDLDRIGASHIAVMDIPTIGIGAAINDRLTRATQ
jgi:L-threonylcarbamoyladenylate synthase